MKKTENKRKEAGDGPLFVKKQYDIIFTNFIIPKVKKVFEGCAILGPLIRIKTSSVHPPLPATVRKMSNIDAV